MNRNARTLVLIAVAAGFLFTGFGIATARGLFGPGGWMGLDSLSDSQVKKLSELQTEMQLEMRKDHNQRQALIDELETLSEDPEGNTGRLGQIQKELEQLELKTQRKQLEHREAMMKLLDDEQWEELATRHAEMMKARGDRPGRGTGPGMGRGHGFGPHGPGYGMSPGMGRGQGFGLRGPGSGRCR